MVKNFLLFLYYCSFHYQEYVENVGTYDFSYIRSNFIYIISLAFFHKCKKNTNGLQV